MCIWFNGFISLSVVLYRLLMRRRIWGVRIRRLGNLRILVLVNTARAEGQECKASENYHRKCLSFNARFEESLEKAALNNIQQYTDADLDACKTFLQIYWTWQAQQQNCVYRWRFYRDLALGGPCFSPFL
ncbi:hypothetical protein PENANT_c015G00210 [Penicillium antarcticum]|uniref:Uncharacterized protein n=1 Tax=Penicillium antarcticum TaxID=416450 RepID=A0A1V6Q3W0_9EURO|nr:hypothetical protein PENANT_c015G00210 [Penicillium antarcticum]